jgi:4-amino-4-deoxy-L-arabinose transferase-like glycosyltransferase
LTAASATGGEQERSRRQFLLVTLAFLLLHAGCMLFRYGALPSAPVLGDEVVINDASISMARGTGLIARSFSDSSYGFDTVFAHFPPIYPWIQSVAFRFLGVSVYSMRLTTTLMSIGSTIVLLLLLYRLGRAQALRWETAALLYAMYTSNASLIALERIARMESMIGFLTLLSLAAILTGIATTQPAPGSGTHWRTILLAAVPAAFCLAVHPESVTALLLLAALLVFVVPGTLRARVIAIAMFALVPVLVAIVAFGGKLFAAFQQFLEIYHGERAQEQTALQWLLDRTHYSTLPALNRTFFLALIALLLLAVPVLGRRALRGLDGKSLRYRLIVCVAVVSVLELLLMVFVFQMNDRRFQFLLGPMLVLDGLCLLGTAPLARWQGRLGWAFVAVQVLVAGFYLAPRRDRVVEANPDRFLPIVRALPPGVRVASTPSLWLDMQEAQRPFSLLWLGLDGEVQWAKESANPLDRFPIVILEKVDTIDREWWIAEARAGRTKYTWHIGSDTVDVYMRGGLTPLTPPDAGAGKP